MDSPLEYEIDLARRCVVVTYYHQPTFAEWVDTMEFIFDDPKYQPGLGMLMDRRFLLAPATTEYIHRMVSFVEESHSRTGRARWALLVADIGSYGMARVAEQLGGRHLIRSFRVWEGALAWLAAPADGSN
ncbi:MAG: hypothetical protein ABJF10_26495 [Chthoniobacter sp.]|uniref:hypothetical protein n=1 Tax=Chthoniobacter sp. TaxID=2510640 RepID=UPI0032AA7A19